MTCPKCPKCKKPLETIHFKRYGEYLYWDKEEKSYITADEQVSETYICPNCHTEIGGWRTNGEQWGFIPPLK
jgi:ribosomal protein L34E